MSRFSRFLLPAMVLAGAVSLHAHAQGIGDAPIRMLVPVSPGGTTDIAARLVADQLTHLLGRAVVVENRVGGTGRIAARALKNAAPDGNTLLLAPIAVTVIAPLVFRQLDYDPVEDFAPIAQVAAYSFALAVTPDLPARTVPEFIRWAKAHPARANFGTVAIGSVPHFLGEMISQETGVAMVHVPYGSLAQLKTELAGGTIPSGISALSDLIELHRSGAIRIIATSGAERSPLLPKVPTFVQQGYPAVEASGWTAMYAPAGTPRAVIDRLSSAIVAAVQVPELRARFMRLGIEPTGTTPQTLAGILAADSARWRKVIAASGFVAN